VLLAAGLSAAAPPKPKLVLVIVVDQCRYDYLTRFRAEFKGGFQRLLQNGANFTDAHDDFFPTLTAVAHAVLLTGAMPSATGIIGNDWFDRKSGKHVTSVSDDTEKIVGGSGGSGVSPRPLLVPTIGDQLKAAGGRPRVIGISAKDRSAILLGGHKADGAFWFDPNSGDYVTSTYYMPALPEWVQSLNSRHPAAQYLGVAWQGHEIPRAAKAQYEAVSHSPFGNRITEDMAERAIRAEKLGKGPDTDLLAVSFSSTDYVGHDYGPDSPEERETLLETDRVLDKLFQTVDREVGLSSVLVVLTADHGVPPVPPDPKNAGNRPGGLFPLSAIADTVQSALSAKYGEGKWVAGSWDVLLYLNRDLIAQKKLDIAEVNRAAAEALRKRPHMARAYTREQLLDDKGNWDSTARLIRNGFNPERAADVVFLTDPFWMYTDQHTTHGTTYDYDTHVPVIFMGSGIRAGSYKAAVRSNDIAPTLAEILGVPAPNASVGRVLKEMFAQ
jgi:predicted AlkP superfamily pyrophosphatase or phosphodiesterase